MPSLKALFCVPETASESLAELVQVATDRHLWAETYESQLGDVLEFAESSCQRDCQRNQDQFNTRRAATLSSARPVSAESYEDYLKGRFYWNKRSEEGLNKAIEYFQLATEKDPHYALAYAGLADCYSIIGSAIVGTVPSYDVAPKAKAAALKALETGSHPCRSPDVSGDRAI